MKITKIHLTNFKRFSDIVIDNIPETSKLVLLTGANGSGKSSVFDAFGFCTAAIKEDTPVNKDFWNYFRKSESEDLLVRIDFADGKKISLSKKNFHNDEVNGIDQLTKTTFYGRTSFRQVPRLDQPERRGIVYIEKDSDRPRFFIDRDLRFEHDVNNMAETIIKDVFIEPNMSQSLLIERYINPINKAFHNIFGEKNGTKLELTSIIPPLGDYNMQVNFTKGTSNIHYNYLGAGEKEVINILMNLLSRKSLYQDTVYFFDEIDLHLNTALQFRLLKEITENWIPDGCQLWVASHSLGFIEYAMKSENASVIDFDNYDFDQPRTLIPIMKDTPDVYEIAVGKEFVPSLFEHLKIYFVENRDKNYYATIGLPKSVFVPENDKNNVFHRVRTTQFFGIIDRDFLSDDDIVQIQKEYPHLHVLEYYSIENYMYHPDNLEEYYQSQRKPFDKAEYIRDLTNEKNKIRHEFTPHISLIRTSYPFFSEPKYNVLPELQNRFKNQKENKEQSTGVSVNLNSNDLETFYKSLPMKDYCTQLPQRQNLSKLGLVRTKWFKKKMSELLHLT